MKTFLIVASFVVIVFLGMTTIASAQADSPKSPIQGSKQPNAPAIQAQGIVKNSVGESVANATVILRAKINGNAAWLDAKNGRDILARTTTDALGRFRFDPVPVPPHFAAVRQAFEQGAAWAEILAWADGCGIAWTDVRELTTASEIVIKLPREAKIEGMVRDKSGSPLEGVRIYVSGITHPNAYPDQQFYYLNNPISPPEEAVLEAFTDKTGHFRLFHVPGDQRVWLSSLNRNVIRSTRIAIVDTHDVPDLTPLRTRDVNAIPLPVAHSPVEISLPLEYVSPQRHVVTARIVDHQEQAVDAGGIWATDVARKTGVWKKVGDGGVVKFVLLGTGKFRFSFIPLPFAPHLSSSTEFEIEEGKEVADVIVRLPEPRFVTGRVVDAETGSPLEGAYVSFSGQAKKDPDAPVRPAIHSESITDRQGTFRLPTLPGEGKVNISAAVYGYFLPNYDSKTKLATGDALVVNIPDSGDIPAVDLKVSRGLCIRGRVLDPSGVPIAGMVVRAQNPIWPERNASTTTDGEGKFTLTGLSPHREAYVTAANDAGIAVQAIDRDMEHPSDKNRWADVELKLEKGLTLRGRILKGDVPQQGLRVRLFRMPPVSRGTYLLSTEVQTDAQGRYRITGLAPGDNYYLDIRMPDGDIARENEHSWAESVYEIRSANYVSEAYNISQSVRIHQIMANEKRAEVTLPDAKLFSFDQTLSGKVVDVDGKPVSGITIRACAVVNDFYARPINRRGNSSKTGPDGQFEMRRLPEIPLELTTLTRDRGETTSRYSAKVRPRRNQNDIRIILDASLNEDEIEDLDAKKPDKP